MDRFALSRVLAGIALALLLNACMDAAPPTLTPTRSLSGPTLAPSPVPFIGPPTEPPPLEEGWFDPTIAALPSGGALPPVLLGGSGVGRASVEVVAEDGALLIGALYTQAEVRAPGVLLLAPDATGWGGFTERLYNNGFTVLAVEPRDPAHWATDFSTLVDSLASGIADPSRIAVVGAVEGADMALVGCAATPLCDGAALLSPLAPTSAGAMTGYNPRPLFITVTEGDVEAVTVARGIEAAAGGDVLFQPLNNAGRGTAILQNRPDVGDLLIAWLERLWG